MREMLESYCRRMGLRELLEQWDSKRNGPLTPENVSYGSKRKVWWQCKKGHHWQAAVHTRTGSGANCPVCAGKVAQAGENDLATWFPQLARQWHPVKNGTQTPEQILPGSHKMAWWICEKGHEWQARVKSRVGGCGCPVCANRVIRPAENDLAAQYPQLAAQWNREKNGNLTPESVAPGAAKKVWWVCERGHEWQAAVSSRTFGKSGCPVCASKKTVPGENDLASVFPLLAEQWNREKNGELTPQQVTPYANRKVWWRCERGHDYLAAVSSRTTNRTGCPYCSGRRVLPGFNDLATVEPEVAGQWHPALNGSLTPQMVTAGAHKKVWWMCSQGHVWKAAIYSRTGAHKCGCPICAGRVSAKHLTRYHAVIAKEVMGV